MVMEPKRGVLLPGKFQMELPCQHAGTTVILLVPEYFCPAIIAVLGSTQYFPSHFVLFREVLSTFPHILRWHPLPSLHCHQLSSKHFAAHLFQSSSRACRYSSSIIPAALCTRLYRKAHLVPVVGLHGTSTSHHQT